MAERLGLDTADGGNASAPSQEREAELVRAARAGSREAFDELVEWHGRTVLRYLGGMSGPGVEAEDLAQEALLQAYRRITTFSPGTDFRAWLLTIAYHTWVHAVRRKRRPVARDHEELGRLPAPEAPAQDGDLRENLRAALATLPDEQRMVVVLRFGEGLSHTEIARITGAEVATVRWRLFRARQVLRKTLRAWQPAAKDGQR